MNRTLAALSLALEALVVVAVGLAVVLVPLTALWAGHYQFALPWAGFWRAASDVWLLGHGVDLAVTVPAGTLAGLGLDGAHATFSLTLAPLGLGLLTALLGFRTGRRAARAGEEVLALAVTAGAGLVASGVVTALAGTSSVRPAAWQGVLLPAFVLVLGVALGAASVRLASDGLRLPAAVPERARAALAAALRTGTAAVALLVAAAALLVAVLLVLRFGRVVGLYEGLHVGWLGGSVVTLGQAALLPNAVIAAASWLLGPGFAIGAGSTVGPAGTTLGPIPGLPLLGILPQGDAAFGFVGLLVPLLAACAAGMLLRRRSPGLSLADAATAAGGAGVIAGIILGLLAWWAGGAAGPGRLQEVGPDPWAAAGAAAVLTAVGALVGVFLRRPAGTTGLGTGRAGGAAPRAAEGNARR